jgi:hypothetical protein
MFVELRSQMAPGTRVAGFHGHLSIRSSHITLLVQHTPGEKPRKEQRDTFHTVSWKWEQTEGLTPLGLTFHQWGCQGSPTPSSAAHSALH